MLPVTVARLGRPLATLQYVVYTSGFVDDATATALLHQQNNTPAAWLLA